MRLGGSSSAVERQLPKSPSFKTINNITRLLGTAKYLKTHGSEIRERVLQRVLTNPQLSHTF